jgi:hypothetical protein
VHNFKRLLELTSIVPKIHHTSNSRREGCDGITHAIHTEPGRILINLQTLTRAERIGKSFATSPTLGSPVPGWIQRGVIPMAIGAERPGCVHSAEVGTNDPHMETHRHTLV